ncbi:MAG: hypothetical protein QGD90_02270 [Candidatus Hydrogenedentes bacterium]|nr:hypothetical protein [Candidatus Hydrogenedentota bacterium]
MREWITRFFMRLLVVVVLFACTTEIAARLYMAIHFDTSFFRPSDVIYSYYPELKPILPQHLAPDDGVLDVLLLGASVFVMRDDHIPRLLSVRLHDEVPRHVRVHNASHTGHTSLDSLNKYRQLKDKRFDCVVFYHNINEIRANNAPDFVFREDYTQYAFYDEVQTIFRHDKMDWLAAPFVYELFLHRLQRRMGLREAFPFLPNEDWVQYGDSIKTVASFRRNLEGIARIARERGDRLLLMKYAYHLPDSYSLEAFENDALDYVIPPKTPILTMRVEVEAWGEVQNVKKALKAHNEVIEETAQKYPEVCYLDQEALMAGQGHYFIDVCHPSKEGTHFFVENLLQKILECVPIPG